MREGNAWVVEGGIDKDWLCKVSLLIKHEAFNGVEKSWLENYSPRQYREKVITRAAEVFDTVQAPRIAPEQWKSRRSPIAILILIDKLHENHFTCQESRRHALDIQKRCGEQSYSLVKGQPSRAFLTRTGRDDILLVTLRDLYLLQETEAECRQMLSTTILESAMSFSP